MDPPKGDKYLFILIDGSGSMNGEEEDLATHLNIILQRMGEKQKEGETPIKVGIYMFNEGFSEVIPTEVLTRESPRLTASLFHMEGHTALYDAVGRTVDDLHVLTDTSLKDITILVATDGCDNASIKYDATRVRKTVTTHRDMGVNFIFISAGPEARQAGLEMGLCGKECMETQGGESVGSGFTSQMIQGALSQALGVDLEGDYPEEPTSKRSRVDEEIYSQYY